MEGSINPHGGRLVNRILEGKEREEALERAKESKKHFSFFTNFIRLRTHFSWCF